LRRRGRKTGIRKSENQGSREAGCRGTDKQGNKESRETGCPESRGILKQKDWGRTVNIA
jgi:hypothetical protein